MKDNSLIIGFVPEHFLFSQSNHQARKQIFRVAQPIMVIDFQLPWDDFGITIHRSTRFGILVLSKSQDKYRPVRFFKLIEPEDTNQARAIVDDFRELIDKGGGQTEYGYIVRDREQIEDNWRFDFNHPEIMRKRKELNDF